MILLMIIAVALTVVGPALLLLLGRLVFRTAKWRPRFLGFPSDSQDVS